MGENEAEKLLAEYMEPKHPEHERYLRENGVGPISDQISAAFKAARTGEYVISNDLVIEGSTGESSAPAAAEPTGATSTASGVDDPQAALREHWGPEFESNYKVAEPIVRELFTNRERALEKLGNLNNKSVGGRLIRSGEGRPASP
jgi:hypothetical protein